MLVLHVEDIGIIHPQLSVAMDREILEQCIKSGECHLHFYRREPSAVSVGHGERIEETVYVERCIVDGVVIIQRESAGSAIYTDKNTLEYAIALPEKLVPFDRKQSYEFLCKPIVEALRSLDYPVVFKPINDIQMNGKKISGSAQKRCRGAVLQHGTVILSADYEKIDRYLKVTPKLAEKGLEKHSERVKGLFEHHRVPETLIINEIAMNFARLLGAKLVLSH